MTAGRVEAIFLFPQRRLPAVAVGAVEALAPVGLVGDRPRARSRQVTLLGVEDWQAALRDVGGELAPVHRRANLVVSGVRLSTMLGCRLCVGDVVLVIAGENVPCRRMDEVRAGLRSALRPDVRAGVCATIAVGGVMRIGDAVALVPDDAPSP